MNILWRKMARTYTHTHLPTTHTHTLLLHITLPTPYCIHAWRRKMMVSVTSFQTSRDVLLLRGSPTKTNDIICWCYARCLPPPRCTLLHAARTTAMKAMTKTIPEGRWRGGSGPAARLCGTDNDWRGRLVAAGVMENDEEKRTLFVFFDRGDNIFSAWRYSYDVFRAYRYIRVSW